MALQFNSPKHPKINAGNTLKKTCYVVRQCAFVVDVLQIGFSYLPRILAGNMKMAPIS